MTYCGIDCYKECSRLAECGGCEKCKGHPFGGSCVAERNKNFSDLKKSLVSEINAFEIDGLEVNDLFLLSGAFVNLEYPLSNGTSVKFLNDKDVYLGNQIEKKDSERCYGVVSSVWDSLSKCLADFFGADQYIKYAYSDGEITQPSSGVKFLTLIACVIGAVELRGELFECYVEW